MDDAHKFLWKTFREWWPAWVEHIDKWEPCKSNSILVRFKPDGYMTSGITYLFGMEKQDSKFFLHTVHTLQMVK